LISLNKASATFLGLVIIGICISSYLVYYHYASRAGAKGWCNINDQINCKNVIQSRYSEIFGVPLAAFGLVWFSVSGIFHYFRESSVAFLGPNAPFYLFVWSSIGVVSVIVLVFLEIFSVGSICLLCTACHIMAVGIFAISHTFLKKPLSDYVRDLFYY